MTAAAGLHPIDAGDVVALCAPGFENAPAELGLLSAERLRECLISSGNEGGRAGVHALRTSGGTELLFRPFRRGGWLAKLGRSPQLPSPERWFNELRVTQELHNRGAPVPEPGFAIACRPAVAPARGWYGGVASVRIPAATNGGEYVDRTDLSHPDMILAASAAGRAVRVFHDCGGRHSDLHIGNLLIADGAAQAWVIDLDLAGAAEAPNARRRTRELARLARSIEKRGAAERIGHEGYAAFLDGYVADDSELGGAIARAWRTERLAISFHRLGY